MLAPFAAAFTGWRRRGLSIAGVRPRWQKPRPCYNASNRGKNLLTGGPIVFLEILGMTLMVIGLVGFLIGVGGILYHLFRAEYGHSWPIRSPRANQPEEVEP